jgi:3-hydroxybutyryl-CoA dehydrogenase
MPRFAAVGAGRMGRGIAIAFAYAGHAIALVDLRARTAEAWRKLADEARAEISGSLEGLAALGAVPRSQVEAIAARVELVAAADASAALADAELVFEGVPETIEAKRDAFAWLNRHARADAILTSTTSSILVTQLARLVERPGRFLNMHWLNPAYLIPVVELSTHPGTEPAVVERARDIMQGIGKLPVVCGPAPGYIVPRLQALVMNEAARMVEESVATPEEIDRATRFGMGLRFAALGVIEFIDFGGADILHHASREMSASISRERYAAPRVLDRMIAQGRLGLKSGSGFYDYAGRDVAAYRRDVLARTLGMLRHAGLWKPPALVMPGNDPPSSDFALEDAGPRVKPGVTGAIRRAFADLSIGQVHYASCGDTSAPAVLLLHQTPRSWLEYRAVLPRLAAGGRRAIAMDTPGFGDSAPLAGPASIEGWAAIAFELLDALDIDRATVVGHHTGGVIALELAAAHPERVGALVLSSTPFTDAAFRRARAERPPIDAVEGSSDGGHLAALWQRRQAFYPPNRPELLEAFVRDALKTQGDVEAGHRAVASYRMEDRIGRVTQPTLVIRAAADPFAAPHAVELRAHLPQAKLIDIEGGMVPLPDQMPEAFGRAVLDFLGSLQ